MSGCDCEYARTHLEELIRGELKADDCGPIRAHLTECSDCSDEQQVFEQLTVAVRRACSEAAPATLRDAIMSSLVGLHNGHTAESSDFSAGVSACAGNCGAHCQCRARQADLAESS